MSAEYFARIRTATGEFLRFRLSLPDSPHADESSVSIGFLPFPPDSRTKRYNGAGGVRDATAQEITDYDDDQIAKKESVDFDGQRMLKAVAIWAAKALSITPAQAKADILTEYRNL